MSNIVKVIVAVVVIAGVLYFGYTKMHKDAGGDAMAPTSETAPASEMAPAAEAPAAEAPAAETPTAPAEAPAAEAPAAPEAAPAEAAPAAPSDMTPATPAEEGKQ